MDSKSKVTQRQLHSHSLSAEISGFLPPQAIELEEAVLGALMLDKESLLDAMALLKAEMFYKDDHQTIFRAIEKLYSSNSPVDILTVSNLLKDTKRLTDIGGPYYITQLTQRVGSGANSLFHAKVIAEKYILRKMISLANDVQKAAYADNFDEAINIFNISALEIDDIVAGTSSDKHLPDLLKLHPHTLEERFKKTEKGGLSGIATGFSGLDVETNGWQPGDLIIIAARPGMGKTAVALHHAEAAARLSKIPVSFFSLEMTDLKLVDRIVCSKANIDQRAIKTGNLSNLDWANYERATRELSLLDIWVDDSPNTTLRHLVSKARAKKRKKELGLIIIDYLQLVETDFEGKISRDMEVQKISRTLKKLAKELQIPIILLCQLNRAVEQRPDKRPFLSDLRESGAIEQDADIVLFPHRPEYYGLKINDCNGAEINSKGLGIYIRAKMREGATGDTFFRYDPGIVNIRDLTQDSFTEEAF